MNAYGTNQSIHDSIPLDTGHSQFKQFSCDETPPMAPDKNEIDTFTTDPQ